MNSKMQTISIIPVYLDSAQEELWRNAHRLAGHAVVLLYFGLPIDRMTIGAEDDTDGYVEYPGPMGIDLDERDVARERRKIARQMILACYARGHAKRMVFPPATEGLDDDGSEDAFHLSWEYGVLPRFLSYVGDEFHYRYLDRLSRESRRLVRRLWGPIAHLAGCLFEKQAMTGEEVEAEIRPILEKLL